MEKTDISSDPCESCLYTYIVLYVSVKKLLISKLSDQERIKGREKAFSIHTLLHR